MDNTCLAIGNSPSIISEIMSDRTLVVQRTSEYEIVGNDNIMLFRRAGSPAWAITKHLQIVRRILARTRSRVSIDELLTGGHQETLHSVLTTLLQRRVIAPVSSMIEERQRTYAYQRVCVCICGSIQASLVLSHLTALRRDLAPDVEVVLTEAAETFVRRESLQALGFRVWPAPRAGHSVAVPHIWLAEKSDAILVLPATASTIHKLARGTCTDLVSLTVAATNAPIIIVPSMNPNMWRHFPIRANLDRLIRMGAYIVEPGPGYVVSDGCDSVAYGAIGVTDTTICGLIAAVIADAQARRIVHTS